MLALVVRQQSLVGFIRFRFRQFCEQVPEISSLCLQNERDGILQMPLELANKICLLADDPSMSKAMRTNNRQKSAKDIASLESCPPLPR
jgi:hypothetical protein